MTLRKSLDRTGHNGSFWFPDEWACEAQDWLAFWISFHIQCKQSFSRCCVSTCDFSSPVCETSIHTDHISPLLCLCSLHARQLYVLSTNSQFQSFVNIHVRWCQNWRTLVTAILTIFPQRVEKLLSEFVSQSPGWGLQRICGSVLKWKEWFSFQIMMRVST